MCLGGTHAGRVHVATRTKRRESRRERVALDPDGRYLRRPSSVVVAGQTTHACPITDIR